ncbi:MAG: translation initiation factor IF-2 [Gemmatimonadales bacterium]
MSTFRVYEVAEELGVESSQLIGILREMEVPVRSHMSVVDEGQIARLHARLERERRTGSAAPASRSEATSRRRRRRRVKPEPIETLQEDAAPEVEEVEEVSVPLETAEVVEGEVSLESTEAAAVTEAEMVEAEALADAELEPELAEAAEADVELAVESEVSAAPAADAELEPQELESEAEVEEAVAEDVVEPVAEEIPEPAAEATQEAAEVSAAAEPESGEAPKRRKRKPKPVRRGMPSTPAASAAPTASAAPGGTVRIQAEGYTVDGRRKPRPEQKRRQRRVDQDAVQENVKRTLAAIESGTGGRKRKREVPSAEQEAELERQALEAEAEKTRVRVNEFLTVSEFADLIEVAPQEIITSAFKNLGLMVTINQRLDFDQIELICEEFGFEAVREEAYEADLQELTDDVDAEEDLVPRAPVVTVMGHVDHGKTSLLDHLRQTNVIAGEAGGITQHIGAYRLELDGGRSVTFLDTPGHEAFTAMRARGAEITDVVVLVVAADDAVMPQTIEAISHAKNAGVPIIVAINKVDLPAADVPKVQQDLLSHDVVLEEFGGDVLSAAVSAKTGQGVDELLEKILLQAELLELKANPDRPAGGTVVEAQLDRGMGPVATVLVQSGTLRVGDNFICGLFGGRVRALLDERDKNVEEAGPSMPVRVLGLEGVPQAGDSLVVAEAERAKEISGRRQQLEREKDMRRRQKGTRLTELFDTVQAGEAAILNLVIKADTDGSVQALSDSLERLSTGEVVVEVIHRGVGAINESDVLLASTSSAAIIGFHVRPDAGARDLAARDGIEIRSYDVIYEAVEDMSLALEGLLKPEQREVIVGTAEVRKLFRVQKVGTVAGCYVADGVIQRNLRVHLVRDQLRIYSGKIDSLKRFKDDVREVREGYECGISIEGYNDIKEGDLIESYRIEEIARTLAESAAATETATP